MASKTPTKDELVQLVGQLANLLETYAEDVARTVYHNPGFRTPTVKDLLKQADKVTGRV